MLTLLLLILAVLVLVAWIFLWFPVRARLRQGKGRLFWLPICLTPLIALALSYPSINEYAGQLRMQERVQAKGAATVLLEDLADLRRRLEAEPQNTRLRLDLGRSYLVLGNRALAEEILDHPSARQDQEALALLLRVHYNDRATRAALNWEAELERRLGALQSVNAQHPTLLSVRAARYAETGDHKNAVILWRKLLAAELEPSRRQQIEDLIRQSEQADPGDG